MKSVNRGAVPEDDEDEEESYMEDSGSKKEGFFQKGDATPKEDWKSNDQKTNTTRSKHSVSEQRRRGKINDRFQILRELVPHGDEKRDRASFLLEVIEYIQFLQEKVQKYEPPNQGWNPDKMKLTAWKNSQGLEENTAMKNGPVPGFIYSGKYDDSSTIAMPALVASSHNQSESDNTGTIASCPNLLSRTVSVPIPLQSCVHTLVPSTSPVEPQHSLISDAENMTSQPPTSIQQKSWSADRVIQIDTPNEQEELTVEGGIITVSSIYSQRLLCTLTHALQCSGLDLSQANISVQIDLGKRGTNKPSITAPTTKDVEDPSCSNHAVADLGVSSTGGGLEQAQKKLKREG